MVSRLRYDLEWAQGPSFDDMFSLLNVAKSSIKSALCRRTALSEWIVTQDWYRSGPIGLLLLVRDESDIIRENLSFHLEQGVDFVIVTDNGSKDGTRDILSEFARLGQVTVLDEPGQTLEQAKWVTRMVRLARNKFRAGWVIPADADEFWMPDDGNYRSELRNPSNAFRVYWRNMLPVAGRTWREFALVADFLVYKRGVAKLLCATRGFHEIYQGNHDVRMLPKLESDAVNLRIYHYPVRSYEQFATKVVNGGRAYQKNAELPATVGAHWREWYAAYEEGRLPEVYAELETGAREVEVDETMSRYFARHAST